MPDFNCPQVWGVCRGGYLALSHFHLTCSVKRPFIPGTSANTSLTHSPFTETAGHCSLLSA